MNSSGWIQTKRLTRPTLLPEIGGYDVFVKLVGGSVIVKIENTRLAPELMHPFQVLCVNHAVQIAIPLTD
jgi:hypothetical protein